MEILIAVLVFIGLIWWTCLLWNKNRCEAMDEYDVDMTIAYESAEHPGLSDSQLIELAIRRKETQICEKVGERKSFTTKAQRVRIDNEIYSLTDELVVLMDAFNAEIRKEAGLAEKRPESLFS